MIQCLRCGKCCEGIIMMVVPSGDQWREYFEAHGCRYIEGVGLYVPSRCQHLKDEKLIWAGQTPRTYCDIYPTRPELCKENSKGFGFYHPDGCVQNEVG